MSQLESLTITALPKAEHSPVQLRRSRLIERLEDQKSLLEDLETVWPDEVVISGNCNDLGSISERGNFIQNPTDDFIEFIEFSGARLLC